jgi:DNA uptake protein ComE-like DNA-binding protein
MMKLLAFFFMLLLAANGMRVQQRRISSSAGNETTKCTYNPQALADCESPAVRQKCGDECNKLCDDITEDECYKSSTTIKTMCALKCAEIVAKTPKGGRKKSTGTHKCDVIETLDQCKGPFKLACKEKCQGFLDKAEAQTCVDLQTRGEPTRVSLTRLLGLTETEAATVLSLQPIHTWKQVEDFLTTDEWKFKGLLAKMDKAKICKPIGEHVDELESPTTLAGTMIMNEEPSCIDINGDETMLRRVRGIGTGSARFILALREENGGDWEDWSEFQQQVHKKLLEYGGARDPAGIQLATSVKKIVMDKCIMFCWMNGKQPFPCSE